MRNRAIVKPDVVFAVIGVSSAERAAPAKVLLAVPSEPMSGNNAAFP